MKSFVMMMPVLEGKLDAWKRNTMEMSKNPQLKANLKKAGATRIRAWSFQTPTGTMGVILHEGPNLDAQTFMGAMFAPDDPTAQQMKKIAEDAHGPMDMSKGPPPMGEPVFEFTVD